jgi:hypothetical protein
MTLRTGGLQDWNTCATRKWAVCIPPWAHCFTFPLSPLTDFFLRTEAFVVICHVFLHACAHQGPSFTTLYWGKVHVADCQLLTSFAVCIWSQRICVALRSSLEPCLLSLHQTQCIFIRFNTPAGASLFSYLSQFYGWIPPTDVSH